MRGYTDPQLLVRAIQVCAFVHFGRVTAGPGEEWPGAARRVFDAEVRAEAERRKERLVKGTVGTPVG